MRGWLCGIAWRKAKGAQRSWAQQRSRDTTYQEGRSPDSAAPHTMEDRLAVKRALQALPIEQRAAVTLCLVCGFSHSEAAEILGAPLGTVKSHAGGAAIGGEIGGAD